MKRGLPFVLLFTACVSAQPKEPLSLQPREGIEAKDYEEVLERWTRTDKVYNLLEEKLFVHAAFHSPEFRRVFLLRHQNVYGRGSEAARRLTLTEEGSEEVFEFFFSAFTPDIKWNDFEKEDSIWRVTLEGDDGVPVDGEISRVKPTANLRVIYPFITDFARTYVARFPRINDRGAPVISAQSKKFTLKIVSALGQANLVWELKPLVRPAS